MQPVVAVLDKDHTLLSGTRSFTPIKLASKWSAAVTAISFFISRLAESSGNHDGATSGSNHGPCSLVPLRESLLPKNSSIRSHLLALPLLLLGCEGKCRQRQQPFPGAKPTPTREVSCLAMAPWFVRRVFKIILILVVSASLSLSLSLQ